MTLHVETKYLTDKLVKIDELFEHNKISTGEYIQIGLLLKITEILNNIRQEMEKK